MWAAVATDASLPGVTALLLELQAQRQELKIFLRSKYRKASKVKSGSLSGMTRPFQTKTKPQEVENSKTLKILSDM